jgi:NADP-dependent 3-hydroxy acid dehydrogenase YdfG
VETEFSLVRFKGDAERAKQTYTGLQPLTPEDIANTILWIIQQPAHVNINEVIIVPSVQANTREIIRNPN